MKAYLKTYGCQMNEQDTLQMKGILAAQGYETTDEPLDADLALLVTCSIREKAVHKVYSDLGRLRELAAMKPDFILGLAGCVAQQEKNKLFSRFPFLDLVFGPDAIRKLPDMLTEVRKQKQDQKKSRVLQTQFDPRQEFEFVNLATRDTEGLYKAFINIQKGCDNVCTFCVVPRTRGREVSRPSRDILTEVGQLVDMGVKEITLLGQNVNSYGLKTGEISFAELVEAVADVPGVVRVRFTTSNPEDVSDALIDVYRRKPKVCSHFHLPVQAGSDRILKAMRRQYTREQYLTIVDKLRQARPGITFSTDIIVGFPGETREDFEQTLSLVSEVGFESLFAFVYSPRPLTAALKLEDPIPEATKKQWLDELLNLQREIARQANRHLVGTSPQVLVESRQEFGPGWTGRTETNKIVHFECRDDAGTVLGTDLGGQILPVTITDSQPFSLRGEYIAPRAAQAS
jgi:tRNA-2-methylthio-N6-dimethylallyladenosine synthase